MKIAIVSTISPFVFGGTEFVVQDMIQNLSQKKDIELFHFALPFPENPIEDLIKFTLSCKSLRFDEYDMIITFKYPAYCIPHRNKVIWLFHQFRQVYDLWGTEFGYQPTPINIGLRDFIKESDNTSFSESKKIICLSKEVSQRLKLFNDVTADFLYAPMKDENKYFHQSYSDFLFYPSRVSPVKRQHLAIQAMAYTKTNVKLIIAGKCADDEYRKTIDSIIVRYKLHAKVKILGEVSQETKFNLFSDSLGSVFVPYKEDYGLVSLEAGLSKKPTVCTKDSGGVVELISHDYNGLIVDPDPICLAQAFDRLYMDTQYASKLGLQAFDFIQKLDLNWDKLLKRILK